MDSELQIIFYRDKGQNIKVEVFFENETFWMTQKKIAKLFGVQRPAITKHLSNIFKSGELHEKVVSSVLEHTTQHGAIEGKTQKKQVKYYNLDAIIAVGYRVNSVQATKFRIWATNTLKEFIIKGFVLDDERLKQGKNFGKDYFDELLERIREIRASDLKYLHFRNHNFAFFVSYSLCHCINIFAFNNGNRFSI